MNDKIQEYKKDKEALVKELLAAGCTPASGNMWKCGFHDDRNASSWIKRSATGGFYFKCFTCGIWDDAIGLEAKRLGSSVGELLKEKFGDIRPPKQQYYYKTLDELVESLGDVLVEEQNTYTNPETNNIDLCTIRYIHRGVSKKDFCQAHETPKGFIKKRPSGALPLFNRIRLLDADIVVFVEGEKVVRELATLGIVATTGSGGAQNGESHDYSPLAGKKVILWADFNDVGRSFMGVVRSKLLELDPAPTIFEIDNTDLDLPDGGDAVDLCEKVKAEGGNKQDCVDFITTIIEDASEVNRLQCIENLLEDMREGKYTNLPLKDFPILTNETRMLLNKRIGIIYGSAGLGKALALNTPIPTVNGWTSMEAIKVGESIFDENGNICTVEVVGEIQENRPCYEVTFSDGQKIVADAEHEWLTENYKARSSVMGAKQKDRTRRDKPKHPSYNQQHKCTRPSIVTTKQIAETLYGPTKRPCINHRIPMSGPLALTPKALGLDPYTLGVWLGDGSKYSSEVYSADEDILFTIGQRTGYRIKKKRTGPYAYTIFGLKVMLRNLGVLLNKHIPAEYLRAGPEQRLDLVQGLMDTDGHITKQGTCEFSNTNSAIVQGFSELLYTLGVRHTVKASRAMLYGRDCGIKYRVSFTPAFPVFKLPRKLARQKPNVNIEYVGFRYITNVKACESVPVRCIQVSSKSHLYLAGEGMIPTHNSLFIGKVCDDLKIAGHKVARLQLEDEMEQHLLRSLAQQSLRGELANPEYHREHPLESKVLYEQFKPTLEVIAESVVAGEHEDWDADKLADWTESKLKAGCKLVVIDPVSVIMTDKIWITSHRLIWKLKKLLVTYPDGRIVLVSHPNAEGDMAGGQSFKRFSHSMLMMNRFKKPKKVQIIDRYGNITENVVEASIDIVKSRYGRGQGLSIAVMIEPSTMSLVELGIIVKEVEKPRNPVGRQIDNDDSNINL